MSRQRFEREWGWWLRSTRRVRVGLAFWWLVPATCAGIACWGTYETMIKLPRDYSILEQRGIRLHATFAGCTGGEDKKCTLGLAGRRWNYRGNHPQFDGLAVGDSIEVVVDPRHPQRRYTAVDLRRHTNEGFGVLFGFSILMGIAAVVGFRFMLRFSRMMIRDAQRRKAYSDASGVAG